MNSKDIKALAKVMQDYGITSLKIGDLELSRPLGEFVSVPVKEPKHFVPVDAPVTEDENPIEHKVEQLKSLMKLNDVELVDQLFPDHSEQNEESA